MATYRVVAKDFGSSKCPWWYWRIVNSDGKILGGGERGYATAAAALAAGRLICKGAR